MVFLLKTKGKTSIISALLLGKWGSMGTFGIFLDP